MVISKISQMQLRDAGRNGSRSSLLQRVPSRAAATPITSALDMARIA